MILRLLWIIPLCALMAPVVLIRLLFFAAVRPWWVQRWEFEREERIVMSMIKELKKIRRLTAEKGTNP